MSKRILIVEDEESIADLEKDYLELSGFEVEVANDGEIGLKKGLEGEFDLIILDLMLPGVDGFEICRQIRSQKNTPIIMVSAKKDDIDKIRGLGLGADDYMTKPFSPSELVARVKAHLARYDRLIGSAAEKNKVIEIRGLKIDTTARRVWVNGEEKNFTTKEFDLLTFLAENPNLDHSRALQLGLQMTKGYKWDIFVLELSFLGWFLLSGISFNIAGIFYVNPYYQATLAEAYRFLRKNALANGYTNSSELPGTQPPLWSGGTGVGL